MNQTYGVPQAPGVTQTTVGAPPPLAHTGIEAGTVGGVGALLLGLGGVLLAVRQFMRA